MVHAILWSTAIPMVTRYGELIFFILDKWDWILGNVVLVMSVWIILLFHLTPLIRFNSYSFMLGSPPHLLMYCEISPRLERGMKHSL